MTSKTNLLRLTDDALRAEALRRMNERDMRYFDGTLVQVANMSAGEKIRLWSREPLLDEDGAKVLADATREYAIPAMSRRDLFHFIHCLGFCPKAR